jgi:hypothetical protein
MELTNSSSPSSITGTEKTGDIVATVSDGNPAAEYERFLHFENVFSGASKKKLLRKCKTCATMKYPFAHFEISGPTTSSNTEFSIFDVLAR